MDWISIIPPIVAVVVVLWRKEVIIALLLAIFSAELLQLAFAWHAPLPATLNTIERIVGVFGDADNARLLIFSLMIGALLAFIRLSGGVAAMVASTSSVYYTQTKDTQKNLQMVFKECIPARRIMALIEKPDDE